ncbi:hypothetical protein [Enterococcus sp. DIV0240a]|uniref:hypothetical protein n=1 Tax=unclassified Enterococcus TaxID=2608891 RepID=UPI003D293CDC
MDYQTGKVRDRMYEAPTEKNPVAHDYQGRDIYPDEMVYIAGEDGLVGEGDTVEFADWKINKLTPIEKLKAIEELISYDVEEDKETMKEINEILAEALLTKISSIGIIDYFEMTYQSVEDSI